MKLSRFAVSAAALAVAAAAGLTATSASAQGHPASQVGAVAASASTLFIRLSAVPKDDFGQPYAALGDSYSSGEGAGDYYKGSCDRSRIAWPLLLATAKNSGLRMPNLDYFQACSGAASEALTKQINAVKAIEAAGGANPFIITLTMGGNDVGFSSILTDCYHKNCIKDGTIEKATKAIDKESKTLVADYLTIIEKDKPNGLLVVGYPRLFDSNSYCGVKWLGLGFKPAELAALNDLDAQLDAVIKAAAATAAKRLGGNNGLHAGVGYANVWTALKGHELCSSKPWVVQVSVDGLWNKEDGHPTEAGQKAIAKAVEASLLAASPA
jgi:lysophospholipase L1-like esterase